MKYYLSFIIHGLPKMTNRKRGEHWAKAKKERDDWHWSVRIVIGNNRPKKPLKKARVTLTRVSSVCPDYDGLVSSFKHVVDALVVSGIIEDDNMGVIDVPSFSWMKCSPKAGHIKVTVEGTDG